MVTILFSAPGVASGSLEVSIWRWTNPNVGPGRGDGQGFDTLLDGITDDLTINADVTEALTPALATDTRTSVADIAQADNSN
jgi:hypothetical protein